MSRSWLPDWALCTALAFVSGAAAAATDCGTNFAQCAMSADRVAHNGNKLETSDETWDTGWFDGFVWGVALSGIQKTWCPKTPFSGLQLSAVVVQYMQARPQDWGQQPTALVNRALTGAFPCR